MKRRLLLIAGSAVLVLAAGRAAWSVLHTPEGCVRVERGDLVRALEERIQPAPEEEAGQIHLGQRIANGFAKPLRQTSGHHQSSAAALLFVSGQFQDGVDGFVYGRLDKAACVYDDYLGFRRLL